MPLRLWGELPIRLTVFILTLLRKLVYTCKRKLEICRSGGIGIRARLKIVFPTGMRVQFPPSALEL